MPARSATTTEIVLQRFRGELTMLDSARGGASGGPPMDAGYDEGFGDEMPARAAPATPSRGGARKPVNDLDDDIPF